MQWDEVRQRIGAGESRTVEFKLGFDTRKVGPAACAFANSDGGIVVMGVSDAGGIVGVPKDPHEVHEELTNLLNTGFNLPLTASYGRHPRGNGWVHWIHVPRQRNWEPKQYRDVAWVRRERSSVRPSPEELQDLYNAFGFVKTEERLLTGAGVHDLDDHRFRQYLSGRGLERKDGREPDILDDYRNFDVVRDWEGQTSPTLFGLLAFGRDPQRLAITRSLLVRNTAYRAASRGKGVLFAAEAHGRLDEQVNRTTDWALSLGRRETRVGIRRVEHPLLPIDALREAVTNAVIHRDYAITGSAILVDLFPDRMEITSPGRLPNGMTVAKVQRGGISRPRNPLMADYGVDVRLMERRGMGWPAIEDAMAKFNGTSPRFEEYRDERAVRVTLFLKPEAGSPGENLDAG